MTAGGLILMVVSWATITALVVFCFGRIFRQKDGETEK